MNHDEVNELVIAFAIASVAYASSFLLVEMMPRQFFWENGEGNLSSAALIFLPHGIRILMAWLYGLKSILLLAPVAYVIHIWRIDGELLSYTTLLAPIVGVACASITFELFERLGPTGFIRMTLAPLSHTGLATLWV